MNSAFRFVLLLAGLWFGAAGAIAQTCAPTFPRTTPNSDFEDAGSGTVRHIPTGLIWKRCAEGKTWDGTTCQGGVGSYDWEQALQRADAVNAGGVSTWNAGRTDWRLPNINELTSIVEFACHTPSVNRTQFPGISSTGFWSSSPYSSWGGQAWGVHFDDGGEILPLLHEELQVVLVRAGNYFHNFDAAAAAPTIGGTPPNGTVGVAYSFTPSATGSPTFSATGLPSGLVINPATGAITGTPTAAGSYNVSITATNGGGTATLNATIVITAAADGPTSAVPTLSGWSLALLALALAGVTALRRRL